MAVDADLRVDFTQVVGATKAPAESGSFLLESAEMRELSCFRWFGLAERDGVRRSASFGLPSR